MAGLLSVQAHAEKQALIASAETTSAIRIRKRRTVGGPVMMLIAAPLRNRADNA